MGQSSRGVFTAVTVIAAACGAKTDLGGLAADDADADAGTTGGRGGSIGASGRGGSGGRGGALGRGGTFGAAGNSAVGGAAGIAGGGGIAGASGRGDIAGTTNVGGSGNIGGSGVGGSGNAAGNGDVFVESVVEALCRRIVPAPCAHNLCTNPPGIPCSFDDCRRKMTSDYQLAILEGCANEYLEYAACYLRTPDICGVLPECLMASNAQRYSDCFYRNDCIAATPITGTCAVNCYTPEEWGAECEPAPRGLICTCSRGPKANLTFTTDVGCRSLQWNQTMSTSCR